MIALIHAIEKERAIPMFIDVMHKLPFFLFLYERRPHGCDINKE